ncbi:MAG: hypothetical protein ACI3XQ_11390 [Eubacteriales bacterium]
MENKVIPEMQRTINVLRRDAERMRRALAHETETRDKAIADIRRACDLAIENERRENAELRAVILYLLDRARADYAVIKKEPFERLAEAVFSGDVNFETAENIAGDYVIRVPASYAVIGGLSGVMHGGDGK